MVKRTKELGMDAVALTDHGNMSGAVELWKACHKADIKAIIGCELYVASGSHKGRKKSKEQKDYHHLVVWARDTEGYKNLCKLVAASYLDGFYYKPRVDEELLKNHAGGLIASTACLAGSVPRALLYTKDGQIQDNQDEAIRTAAGLVRRLQNIFDDRLYLELQDHGIDLQFLLNLRLVNLSKATGAPLIWTNDCHFLKNEDFESHKAFKCIQGYRHIKDMGTSQHVYLPTHHFRSEDDMRKILDLKSGDDLKYPVEIREELTAAFDRTIDIADACTFDFWSSSKHFFPAVQKDPDQSLLELFREKVFEGFEYRARRGQIDADKYQSYVDRLIYETQMIQDMGFESYFLIVADMVQWAKLQGIPVGPGRGSAAGSIISWCLQITDIDPVKYELLFERFLNPSRVSLPDIDLDFSKRRRHEVIEYAINRYGRENVAQIVTFATLAPRRVINDMSRVFALTIPESHQFSATLPDTPGKPYSLEEAYRDVPEFKRHVDLTTDHMRIFETAKKLEDANRHAGIHAAGLVITPTPVTDYAPLYQQAGTTDIAVGYDMKSLEQIGLIKMDLLGLKTLDVIDDTIKMVKLRHNIDVDWDKVDLNDPQIYSLFAAGKTKGVFQFESRGMRGSLVRLEPDCFEHIVAMNALYRPGPNDAGMTDQFISRKRGDERVEVLHPALEHILSPTYGVLVYQEQVMKTVQALAGYTLAQADLVRKAMGKKDVLLMQAEIDKFIEAAVAFGNDRKEMEAIAESIRKFARYGFNRAHAAAYAYIAFQTAYLLKHFPLEFMCSVLVAEAEDNKFEKLREYVGDVKRLGLQVLPPDVNESQIYFSVEGKDIRYGLAAIKGVGEETARNLIAERTANGPFKSFVDLLFRVKPGKGLIEPLIAAGATESLATDTWEDRTTHQENYADILKSFKKNLQATGQTSLFSADVQEAARRDVYQLKQTAARDPRDVAADEKEVLGLWLCKHPLDGFKSQISDDLASMRDQAEQNSQPRGFRADLACVLNEVVYRTTRTGKRLAILSVEDLTAESDEVKVWGDEDIDSLKDILVPGAIIKISGKASKDKNGRFQFNVKSGKRLDIAPVLAPIVLDPEVIQDV
jgi:DNA polymerase-3 subunit alpha